MLTMRPGSPHCGFGPTGSVGAVSVRSARWPRVYRVGAALERELAARWGGLLTDRLQGKALR